MRIANAPIASMIAALTVLFVAAQTDSVCQDLLSDYASCLVDQFDSQNDAALCDECRIEYAKVLTNSSSSELTCEYIERLQCSAVLECPCGGCGASLDAYLNCEVLNYNNSE
jgi:hypothetical protein